MFRITGIILLIFIVDSCKKDKPTSPVLTTTAISGITATTAISGGNITSDGGASVSERGVCWNTLNNPTTVNNKTSDGTGTEDFASFAQLAGMYPPKTNGQHWQPIWGVKVLLGANLKKLAQAIG